MKPWDLLQNQPCALRPEILVKNIVIDRARTSVRTGSLEACGSDEVEKTLHIAKRFPRAQDQPLI
jgi:hypothetical protein